MLQTDDITQYEYTSVKTVRGTEGRTIAKWQDDGWELDTQSPGTLRTELTFRRAKPTVARWKLLAGAGAVVMLAAAIGVGVVVEKQGGGAAAEPTASQSQTAAVPSEPSERASAPESQAVAPSAAPEVLTAGNNADLAALLTLTDPADSSVPAFAAAYQGATIEFDGNVAAMNNHGSYTTRYDILVFAGDYSETTWSGPNFQFRDVNTTYDLHLQGDVPDTIGIGDNLHIVARVVEYNATQELFFLEPVATSFR